MSYLLIMQKNLQKHSSWAIQTRSVRLKQPDKEYLARYHLCKTYSISMSLQPLHIKIGLMLRVMVVSVICMKIYSLDIHKLKI